MGETMVSKILRVIAFIFWGFAALVWVVLGLASPGGVDRMGQPLDPDLYYQVGSFGYWLIGSAFLIPVGIIAAIGFLFNWMSEKFSK
jgi:hypothetical protein